MTNSFWFNNPSILLDNAHFTEIIPKEGNLALKLNAITRLIILITIVSFGFTRSLRVLISAGITLCSIEIIYKIKRKSKIKSDLNKKVLKEGFINSKSSPPIVNNNNTGKFVTPTTQNPLMNVLLTDITDNPTRNAAAPSFNPEIEKNINKNVKKNSEDKRLFLDLGDNINFESSMQRFYTTANTRVCNDQTAFAKYCYGDMPSCKEGDGLQCTKNNGRWINY